MLRAAIRKAGGADRSTSGPAGKALRLARPSGRSEYQVVVLPLPQRCQPADASGVVAVLFVTDPERSHSPIDHLVADLFGLTEAEVRLVMQLLGGSTLTDAAETLGLSRNTVHSQLASVFRKTGTSRQSDLVRVVLRALAPVRGPDDSSGFYIVPDDGRW
jgi:DNA-binding CsgD family transcriptional regulator